MIPGSVSIGGQEFTVWPAGQGVELLAAPNMAVTDFEDCVLYHPGLMQVILQMEHDEQFRDWIFKGGCGTKVRNPHLWQRPEADLIHARAMRMAARALGVEEVFVDECWANVYRKGDYCMPHSHLRSSASLIYMVDPGDILEDDPLSGRLCFGDPRIPFCCAHEPGRMTQLLTPEIDAGSLLIFPSDYIHSVNPYNGERPRVTMSWNINAEKLAGDPAAGWRRPAAVTRDP